MCALFPENTPLYIRLKYQYHAGISGEVQSRDNFLEFLFKDAYWYGINSCPTAIKMIWLESQSWAASLFDELTVPCDGVEIKLFNTAKIFHSVREDLKQKYILRNKYDLTGYLFDIYFGDSSKEYSVGSAEKKFLSQHADILKSRLDIFQYCNAFYLLYIHKAKDILMVDIGTEKGQKIFIAFLFVNSAIWFDKVNVGVASVFFHSSVEDVVEYVRLLLQHITPEKNWDNTNVVDYVINNQNEFHVHKALLVRLRSFQDNNFMNDSNLSSRIIKNDEISLFEKFLHSANGGLPTLNAEILDMFSIKNENGELKIIDDTKSYVEEYVENNYSYNVAVKRVLCDNFESINSELLQYYIINFTLFTPIEIYASVESFRFDAYPIESLSRNNISVIGFSRSEIGTGEDTRNSLKALNYSGKKASIFNIVPENSIYNNQESTVQKFEVDQIGYVQIYTMPPMNYMCQYLTSPLIHDAKGYKIGYFAWEFSEWRHEYDSIYDIFDEIWVISKFLLPAFKNTNIPVNYVPPVVTLTGESYADYDVLADLGLPKDKFLFLFVFDIKSGIARKNPVAVIKGFLSAFPDDDSVGLVLKFSYDDNDYESNRDLFLLIEQDRRIHLVSGMLKKSQIESLISQCDAVVSLHRSEGFGRIMAEAMLLKTLVICTGFSGNMDYCNNETVLLVDYELIKVKAGEYPFAEGLVWADVKHESVVKQMKKARSDIEVNSQRIESAYKMVVKNHSLQSTSRVMAQRLDELSKY